MAGHSYLRGGPGKLKLQRALLAPGDDIKSQITSHLSMLSMFPFLFFFFFLCKC